MARSTLEEFKRLLWQTFNNNYSNGNLQLSFPEKVPSETEAPTTCLHCLPCLHRVIYASYIVI